MSIEFNRFLENELKTLQESGLYKQERKIISPQSGHIKVAGQDRDNIINLCANNYLGLANDHRLIQSAKEAMDREGYGMASVRFICGTGDSHRVLETRLADFLGKDDALLFAACFDANGGLFEALLDEQDAVISDALNHASIIDGIRLCKAKRYRYRNSDMEDLEDRLKQAKNENARFIMIATDGVFSMDGYIAKLPDICALAEKYDALVMVDDCHSTGFMGEQGRGTPSHFNVQEKVDIISGTLGKALGGAIGGYIVSSQAIIDMLRQRARPYLFSNSLPPSVVAAGITVLDIITKDNSLRDRLFENTNYWRLGLEQLGFSVLPGEHPIVPVMLGEASIAQNMSRLLMEEGVYVTGFFYPVVPKGEARIRTQMNAALTKRDLDAALAAFAKVGKALGVLS